MDINVKVRLESPELMAAILALVEALPKLNEGANTFSAVEDKIEIKELSDNSKIDTESIEPKNISEKEVRDKAITLEEVRKVLASKSQSGKQAEVKELIKRYGVNKLTDIHPCNYKELMEFAEVL